MQDAYSSGESEKFLGKAIKKFDLPRGKIVVATKVFFPFIDGEPGEKKYHALSFLSPRSCEVLKDLILLLLFSFNPGKPEVNLFGKKPEDYGLINQSGLSRKHIFDAVEASLKRLQLDYIDLYQ